MVFIIDPQNAGISGNMIIGALVDLGADSEKVKNIMEDAIVALGIEKQEGWTEKKYQWYDNKYYNVDDVVGMSKKEATSKLNNFSIEYSGSGDTIISQSPEAGSRIAEGSSVRLYLGWFDILSNRLNSIIYIFNVKLW